MVYFVWASIQAVIAANHQDIKSLESVNIYCGMCTIFGTFHFHKSCSIALMLIQNMFILCLCILSEAFNVLYTTDHVALLSRHAKFKKTDSWSYASLECPHKMLV